MAIPKQVQKQSEAVQELYKELNEEEVNENQEVKETLEDVPAADSVEEVAVESSGCLLYTSPSPRDLRLSRMPSSA